MTSQKKLSTHAETLIELCNFLSHRSTQIHRQTRCESEGNDWPGGLCWSCWTCREPNSVRPSNLRRLWFHLVARRAAAALMAKWRQTLPERESSGCCASFQHSPQSFILVIRSLRSRRRPTRKKKKLCRFADTSRSAIGLSHGSQIAGRQCSELVSLHPRLSVARRRCGCWCIQLLQGLRQDATTSTARYWAQLQQLLRAVYCGPASHKRRAALRTLLFGFARRDRMSGIFMTLSLPTADTVLHNLRILICKSVCSIM